MNIQLLTENEKQLFLIISQIDITKATEREKTLQQILLYIASLFYENKLDELLKNIGSFYPEYSSYLPVDESGAHTNPIAIDLNNLIERWEKRSRTLSDGNHDSAHQILEPLRHVERIIEFGSSAKLQKLIEQNFEVHEYGF